MSNQTIGLALKNSAEPFTQNEGVQFELPYDEETYRVLIRHSEMDLMMSEKIAELMGRDNLFASVHSIELEVPDLPLSAWAASLVIEEVPEPQYPAQISMGVAVATQSTLYEHRGLLLACRHHDGAWERIRYNEEPSLPFIEEVARAKGLIAA